MKRKLLARFPLGNPRRIWQQDYFIFSAFSPGVLSLENDCEELSLIMRRSVKTCVDAGFNLLELGWASPERGKMAVRMCEQLGVGVIYQNLKRYGGMGRKNVFCETNDLIGSMEEMRHWKSIAGYYLWDEPHTVEQMKNVRAMMDLCERKNPNLLPFTVALPSYNKICLYSNGKYPEYITNYCDIIDPPIMSFDYYPIGKGHRTGQDNATVQLDESHLWYDLEYVYRAAKERDIPFWFYYQGQNLHNAKHFCFGATRLMMHGALLYGVKGLQHYTPWDNVVDPETGKPGPTFEEQKQVHAELRELGNTLMALSCDRVIHDDALLPNSPYMNELRSTMKESKLLKGKLPFRTSVSELSDAYGNRYLMVLNRDYLEEKDIALELKAPSHVYEVSKTDGEQYLISDSTQALNMHLIPGGMALYRIQPAEEEAFTVEYYLEKEPV